MNAHCTYKKLKFIDVNVNCTDNLNLCTSLILHPKYF